MKWSNDSMIMFEHHHHRQHHHNHHQEETTRQTSRRQLLFNEFPLLSPLMMFEPNLFQNRLFQPDSFMMKSLLFSSSTTVFTIMEKCSFYFDMIYDDRLFFGFHNFNVLKNDLSTKRCNVDFSTSENKVNLIGPFANVFKIYDSLFAHSTFGIQFQFVYCDPIGLFDFLRERFKIFQREYGNYEVFISYQRDDKPNTISFSFLTFRKCLIRLIQTLNNFMLHLDHLQVGFFQPEFTTTFQIPTSKRDPSGLNSAFVESIENKTRTKISIVRYPHCFFENITLTSKFIFGLIEARWSLTARFTCEMKFQISTSETEMLVRSISELDYDRTMIDISISPCSLNRSDSRMVSIKSLERNNEKIFKITNDLLELRKSRSATSSSSSSSSSPTISPSYPASSTPSTTQSASSIPK
ncbi:hypothetical protein SSS_10593 [Sarcoptes scabiei]|nr:hypothetical protein SSS_10593 [Sarcoptes scabiei]